MDKELKQFIRMTRRQIFKLEKKLKDIDRQLELLWSHKVCTDANSFWFRYSDLVNADEAIQPHWYTRKQSIQERKERKSRKEILDRELKEKAHSLSEAQINAMYREPLYGLFPDPPYGYMPNASCVDEPCRGILFYDKLINTKLSQMYMHEGTWFKCIGGKPTHTLDPRWTVRIGHKETLVLRYLCRYEVKLLSMGIYPRGGWFEVDAFDAFFTEALTLDDIEDVPRSREQALIQTCRSGDKLFVQLNHICIGEICFPMYLDEIPITAAEMYEEWCEDALHLAVLFRTVITFLKVCNGWTKNISNSEDRNPIEPGTIYYPMSKYLMEEWRHKNVIGHLKRGDEAWQDPKNPYRGCCQS